MATKIKLGNGNWGVKPNGVLAYNDENNVFKAIELQSSRASGATYVGEDGLIKDAEVGVPRIDWTNGIGELLLEPQSRNLIPYSENFSNVAWGKQEVTINANASISPDGNQNADKLIPSEIQATHQLYELSLVSSQICSLSIFAKADGINTLSILDGSTASNGGQFNVLNGTFNNVGSGVSKIEDFGNGWYRCSTIVETTGIRIYCPNESANAQGDGTSGVYIWGAQLEQLSYPTSYIRTEGSQVTRIADAVTGNSSLGQVINSSEGVLYAEMSALVENDSIFRNLSLSDGSSNNRVLFYYSTTANQIGFSLNSGGVSQGGDIHTLSSALDNIKIAIKYANNDLAFWVNGVEVSTDPLATMPTGLDKLSFDNSSTANFYGRIRELKVYDTALTDAQLQTLTTI